MGNKPDRELFASGFTERLTRHPRIAYYIYPDCLCGTDSDWNIVVSFVVDQLLVTTQLAEDPKFNRHLSELAEPTHVHVFDPGKAGPATEKNVQIWRLKESAQNLGEKSHADVAHAVWSLRKNVPEKMDKAMVAPNHVLVPPGRTHECPFGPPDEHPPVSVPPRVSPLVEVVVIDSGFILAGPVGQVITNLTFSESLQQVPGAGPPLYDWQPGTEAPPGVVDPLDQNGDGMLDALAGHANFVAGVVARGSEHAELTVESLNCSVIDSDTSVPGFVTEAEVARSWWEHRLSPVVNVGFAFATLPNQALAIESDPGDVNGPPSWPLRVVMESVGGKAEHVVVAPAGNQRCTVPQYPAAFSVDFDNVAGVGSVDASGHASVFSNHGSWVNCCTEGEDVASTFIDHWDGKTEEADPNPNVPAANQSHPTKHFSGWASWSGTSFAAPKVSAAIADAVASSIATGAEVSPQAAWAQLKSNGMFDVHLDMGVRLQLPD
jgi:hypothetical protein